MTNAAPTLPGSLLIPPRTIYGRNCIDQLCAEGAKLGRRGCIVHGRSLEKSGTLDRITSQCPDSADIVTRAHEGGEPTVTQVDRLREFLRSADVEWVGAVGGGSVLDLARAASGLLNGELSTAEYQDGAEPPSSSVPLIAAPTTAGTGSEATIVSVLINAERGLKSSIRHPSYLAKLVMLDPALLSSCPPAVIAASGMDAFVQAIESYMSRNATRLTDVLALEAMESISSSLATVFSDPSSVAADDLLAGSYLAGLALSNARLGLVHGLVHPLGARYHAPHGLLCGICIPYVLEFNREAVGVKYRRGSEVVGRDLLERVDELLERMSLKNPLAGQELVDEDAIVKETLASGSTRANPREVTGADVREILRSMFS